MRLSIRTAALVGAIVILLALGALVVGPAAGPSDRATAATMLATTDGKEHGQECLDSLRRRTGRLDLCWAVDRVQNELDQGADYYVARIYGSAFGEDGTGLRWIAARIRPVAGAPAATVLDRWPTGTYDGACTQMKAGLAVQPDQFEETICGRTIGALEPDGEQTVAWICSGCIFPDRTTRAVILLQGVSVAPGDVPAWEVFADLGD